MRPSKADLWQSIRLDEGAMVAVTWHDACPCERSVSGRELPMTVIRGEWWHAHNGRPTGFWEASRPTAWAREHAPQRLNMRTSGGTKVQPGRMIFGKESPPAVRSTIWIRTSDSVRKNASDRITDQFANGSEEAITRIAEAEPEADRRWSPEAAPEIQMPTSRESLRT